MATFEILPSPDDRALVPSDPRGCFYVTKQRTIAYFEFGTDCAFTNGKEASEALALYLSRRKDADKLTVTYLARK